MEAAWPSWPLESCQPLQAWNSEETAVETVAISHAAGNVWA
jgi:hypothetical protein